MVYWLVRVGNWSLIFFFCFNDTATTEIYTLSLHDALPISIHAEGERSLHAVCLRSKSCGAWFVNSRAKTCSAELRKMAAPSGCLHAPRPRTSPAQRWRRLRSSGLGASVAMRVQASA